MLKMILLLARRTFIRLLLVLLPLGLFAFLAQAIPLSPLQSLVVLIPVIAFEVWLVVKYLLPVMGDLVTKTAGSPGTAGTLPEGKFGAGAFLAHGIQPAERYAPVCGFR